MIRNWLERFLEAMMVDPLKKYSNEDVGPGVWKSPNGKFVPWCSVHGALTHEGEQAKYVSSALAEVVAEKHWHRRHAVKPWLVIEHTPSPYVEDTMTRWVEVESIDPGGALEESGFEPLDDKSMVLIYELPESGVRAEIGAQYVPSPQLEWDTSPLKDST